MVHVVEPRLETVETMTRKKPPTIGYHWSPTIHRDSIKAWGLRVSDGGITRGKPTVCLSPTPGDAWWLSAGMRDPADWDLWQVQVPADAFWRSDGYPELRTFTNIPADELTYIASRLA